MSQGKIFQSNGAVSLNPDPPNASSNSLLGYRLPYIRPQMAQLSEGLQKEANDVIKNYNSSNADSKGESQDDASVSDNQI